MATVLVEGVFMGANVKTSTYEGVTKSTLYIDVYQPESTSKDRMVQLKTDDVSMINRFHSDFDMGSKIKANASVNAYMNTAYFKLLEVVE